jgi:hypothetical protein
MADPPHNPDESRRVEPEPFTGVYQPRRGPLAKTLAVLILVLLILVPVLLALVTMHRWDPEPGAGPAAPESSSAAPE